MAKDRARPTPDRDAARDRGARAAPTGPRFEHASEPAAVPALRGLLAAPPALGRGGDALLRATVQRLQRTYGNRAVAEQLRPAAGAGAALPAVQRVRNPYPTTHAPNTTQQNEFDGFADEVNKLMAQAYKELTDLTFINSWTDTTGTRIQYFKDQWDAYVNAGGGSATALLAAAAGYAIETQVTQLMATNGMSLGYVTQDPQGGTRPDIVATSSDGAQGWIDLTSQNEAAQQHILRKNPSWLNRVNVPFVEENYYPTVNFVPMLVSHQLGVVPKSKRARKDQTESAAILAQMQQAEDRRNQREIDRAWRDSTGLSGFASDYGFSKSEAQKVLYFAGIDQYGYGKHPAGAKGAGKKLWQERKSREKEAQKEKRMALA